MRGNKNVANNSLLLHTIVEYYFKGGEYDCFKFHVT
jgi:hypothetical protein